MDSGKKYAIAAIGIFGIVIVTVTLFVRNHRTDVE